LLDIPDQWEIIDPWIPYGRDDNLIVTITRSTLTVAASTESQAQFWQSVGYTCNVLDILQGKIKKRSGGSVPLSCGLGTTFGNMSSLVDPFLAELPNGYSTGLIRHFIPRFNTTAKYKPIPRSDDPIDCDRLSGAFLDFSEQLHFNISIHMVDLYTNNSRGFYRATLNTTAGYFK